jgi:hypothetical protein
MELWNPDVQCPFGHQPVYVVCRLNGSVVCKDLDATTALAMADGKL